MTEIRPAIDTRHVGASSQMLGQLPPPPAKAQRIAISKPKKQNSLKRESETSPSHQSLPIFSQSATVISCPVAEGADSVSSSPTDAPSSPKQQPCSQSADKSWSFLQKQDGHLSWAHFEERHQLLGNEEDSSERHSSEEEFDIWSITDEQREYYVNQFRSMQTDLKGKITGATAKEFFEKSKLPVLELSKIWQLSDVDKDGALSLEEFCTAMHLVVLRRNNIELPEVLPPSLIPKIVKKLNDNMHQTLVANQPQVQHAVHNQSENSPKQSPSGEVVSPPNKEWTKFNDSPTSSLSSPGMKPVNFDFSAASVEQDPKILHPVALRLSPDRQSDTYSGCAEQQQPATIEDVSKSIVAVPTQAIQRPAPRKPLAPSLSVVSHSTHTCDGDYDAITGHSSMSSFSGTSHASRSMSLSHGPVSLPQGPKKEPPPPPPPRPKHNHTRSSSLDLNKLGSTVPHFLGVPPAVPPRISPSTSTPQKSSMHGEDVRLNSTEEVDFADFANFDDSDSSRLQLQLKSGAFAIYKKPFFSPCANSSSGSEFFLIDQACLPAASDDSTALLVEIDQQDDSLSERKRHLSAPPLALAATVVTTVPQDKRELQSAIRAHRERNMMLSLVNNELNQELSEVMEERIALEIQLEHIKPFS